MAIFSNTSGYYNTANGDHALYSNTTGGYNIANGYNALYSNTTGNANTANGGLALFLNTTGSYNTANGYQALYSNTDGYYNTANGYQALFSNTSGYYNTANGYFSLRSNIGGSFNTANGYQALYSNTTGDYNTANGYYSLYVNATGNYNTTNGSFALLSNTTGSSNTAIGAYALYFNKTISNLVAVGDSALRNLDGGSGHCTAIGSQAGWKNSTGSNNTYLGYHSGNTVTTGNSNTFIGFGADDNAAAYTNTTALGNLATCTASNQVRIGNANVTSIGGYTNWSVLSDGRVKKNVRQNVPGLAFINKLKPVTYNLDLAATDKIIFGAEPEDKNGRTIQIPVDETAERKVSEKIVHTGFIAQDVEKVAKEIGYDFNGVDVAKNDQDLYGLRYGEFVVPLVKAVQELSKMNDEKDAKIVQLTERMEKLEQAIKIYVNNNEQTVSISSASLAQNVPNPFANTTTISYRLPQKFATAQIIITDKSGKQLKQLNVSGSGNGIVNIDAASLAPGAYNYSLIIDGRIISSKQMIAGK
jgi:hypothetical protein